MRVLVVDILAKINDLPADFRDHVQIDPEDKSLAYVTSFTSEDVYTVHIKPHVDDPGDKSILNSTCPCDARTLCRHVTAFYAKSKGLGPQVEPKKSVYEMAAELQCDPLLLAETIHEAEESAAEKPSGAPETEPILETVQIPVDDKFARLRALTMAAIDTDLKAHEARVAMLLEVERIARGE